MELFLNPQIFYYSTMMFQLAGVSNADVVTVSVGVVLVSCVVVSVSQQYFCLKFFHPELFLSLPPSLPPSFVPSLPPSLFPSLPLSLPQILLVEVVGRRSLMLYGLGGMAIFFALLTSMFCLQVCSPLPPSLLPLHSTFHP